MQKDGTDTAEDMETRSCQCDAVDDALEDFVDEEGSRPTSSQSFSSTAVPSIVSPFTERENNDQETVAHESTENGMFIIVNLLIV